MICDESEEKETPMPNFRCVMIDNEGQIGVGFVTANQDQLHRCVLETVGDFILQEMECE